jgi:CheY-like chemotaxis protein
MAEPASPSSVEVTTTPASGGQLIDVVVSDAVMPRMSGYELARELQTRRPDVPIVFMAADAPRRRRWQRRWRDAVARRAAGVRVGVRLHIP